MMILVSPWSRNTQDGKPSPKNYPWWPEVVEALPEVVQVSVKGEPELHVTRRYDSLSLNLVEDLIKQSTTWVSVDNFFHHLAWSVGKPGVVIFGKSDPLIFGHSINTNLLKDRKYLRQRQFGIWAEEIYDSNVFPTPDVVIASVKDLVRKQSGIELE